MNLNQPDLGQEVIDRLSRDYGSLGGTLAEYRKLAQALPPDVTDKASHDAFADLVAKVKASAKHIEGVRIAEKDPFLRQERAVDGFFSPVLTALEKLQKALTLSIKAYLDRKAEDERRARDAAAAEARAEAERLRFKERQAAIKAEEARQAVARAAQAQAHEQAVARAAQERAEAEQHSLAAQASRAEVASVEHTAASLATPAAMARTRSDVGTLSTLRSEWMHEVTNYDAIPLDQLRAYIPRKVIDTAIAQAVRMGVRKLEGVRIFEGTKAVIR